MYLADSVRRADKLAVVFVYERLHVTIELANLCQLRYTVAESHRSPNFQIKM